MDDADQELLDDFVVESKEGLESIEEDFLTLEQTQDDPDIDLVNKVFRAIHSMKGGGGFLGLESLVALAHIMENIISQIREKIIKPESHYVDTLLEGVDALRVMLDDIAAYEQVETASIIAKLEALLDGDTASAGSAESTESTESAQTADAPAPQAAVASSPSGVQTQEEVLAELDRRIQAESGVQTQEEVLAELDRQIQAEAETEQAASAAVVPQKAAKPAQTARPAGEKSKPADTIRIGVDLLDNLMRMAGELVLVRNQQLLHVNKEDAISRSICQKLDTVTSDLQEGIMKTRMQPIGNIFGKFPRIIRDMSKKLGKNLIIETTGDDVELDKTILESLANPLTHLIRNSCDHGIEDPAGRIAAGKTEESIIKLQAYHEGGQIHIKIVDDGRGINIEAVKEKVFEKGLRTEEELANMSTKELANLITLPGLSTAKAVTDVSGRGVGMDVVCTSIEDLGGTLDIETASGKGTTITLKLPLTLAIIPSLLVRVGGERFAIPQVSLEELVCLYNEEIEGKIEIAGTQEVFRLRDRLLPIVYLNDILKESEPLSEAVKGGLVQAHEKQLAQGTDGNQSLTFAVLKLGSDRFGLIIDEVIGTEEIVVKPMHPALSQLHCYSGSTVLGDGKVALILDVDGLSRFAGISYHSMREERDAQHQAEDVKISVLLFKNGAEEQFALPLTDIKRIERVSVDSFEAVGGHTFINIDEVPTRIVNLESYMPVSTPEEAAERYLILPKGNHPFGIIASSLVNIAEVSAELNEETFAHEGLLGTSLVDEHMTLFVNIQRMGEIALKEIVV